MTTTATSATRATRNQYSSGMARALSRLNAWMDSRPLIDYTMVRTIVLVLAGLGVVMVTSSSMTWSAFNDESVWAQPLKQAIVVGMGLFAFWVALQIPPEKIRNFAAAFMGVSILLLILVLIPGIGTGRDEVGSQSWIYIAGLQLQPSEIARVAICVWGASILANKNPRQMLQLTNGFAPFIGVSIVCMGLIGAQGDLGMMVSFAIVVAFILLFAGVTWKFIGIVAGFGVALLIPLMAAGGYRSDRLRVYVDALFGHFEDTRGSAFQSYQGFLSLADGSFFGVGLGQSRAKWFYLPEAKNDFIFAVIGEELGLWGGALVIILFALLLFFGLRTARRAQNQFQALLAAAITTGIVSQAFINIGYVIGLLPVTGIQLPMISAGGTSAVITLGAMGLVASVARHEPDAVSFMQNYGRPLFDRMFFLAEPKAPRPAVRRGPRQAPRRVREAPVPTPVTARRRTQYTDTRRAS
ncbi:putative peptidoglycan glycosyltransferase FtsW [Corynebacterium sp. MSK044]|uniref:FtsW/RodA/SpoVE family cell cycle protein n=1 Tax=Corynebacterium sp. MSK044 TaxID=3050195 RepID=UPI00254EDA83|nr:putative peptidoglycan glycosyltransferase FtsW [Corynebacterium sp. MSK044]MDK8796367.1 putative peptidoglycan glycosyltransferase FtsW [Corynebacterium sp. MSK044]